jgi:hypothetical protein
MPEVNEIPAPALPCERCLQKRLRASPDKSVLAVWCSHTSTGAVHFVASGAWRIWSGVEEKHFASGVIALGFALAPGEGRA